MKAMICLLLCMTLCAALFTGCGLFTFSRLGSGILGENAVPLDPSDKEISSSDSADTSDSAPEDFPVSTEPSEESGVWSPTGEQMQKDNPVYELYSEALEDWYSYHVPQINCNSPDAKAINQAIAENYGTQVEQGLADTADGYMPSCYGIGYAWHWFEDVLVLQVWEEYPNDCIYYQVWCLDRVTGIQLTNEDILAICHVSEEDFVAQATIAATAKFYQLYPEEIRELAGADFYDERLAWTQSEENINLDMVMFPDEEGSLMLISPIGAIAGASSYEHSYPYLS